MKVAILGTVGLHRQLAPFDDPEWEIWPCSPGNAATIDGKTILPRITKWFELHGIEDLKGRENSEWNGRYFHWLSVQTFPVVMQEPCDFVPHPIIFPLKKWLAEFGDLGRIAATSSISLMVGYAIMLGASEIGVWGVDMAATEEQYGGQKAGCQIMFALAKARGIKIRLPLESTLGCLPPVYGYAEASRMGRAIYAREVLARQNIAQLQNQIGALQRDLAFNEGQLEQILFTRRTYVDGVSDAELDLPPEKPLPDVMRPELGTYTMNEGGVLVRSHTANGDGRITIEADTGG